MLPQRFVHGPYALVSISAGAKKFCKISEIFYFFSQNGYLPDILGDFFKFFLIDRGIDTSAYGPCTNRCGSMK